VANVRGQTSAIDIWEKDISILTGVQKGRKSHKGKKRRGKCLSRIDEKRKQVVKAGNSRSLEKSGRVEETVSLENEGFESVP